MKKTMILTLALLLSFSLAACGRRDKTPMTTEPTRATSPLPSMDPTILDPTFETNIPDPSVDTSMPGILPDMTVPNFTDTSDPTATYKEGMK